MNFDNVVRIDDFARSRSARRGAPDKMPFDEVPVLELECPRCAAVLRLSAGAPSEGDVQCDACGAALSSGRESIAEGL